VAVPQGVDAAQFYLHLRVLVGLVLGLGLTRLLAGVSHFIQHPGKLAIFPPHLIWVATLALMMMNFWWWEFALIKGAWNFGLFAFVLFYAFLFFLLASLLFPDEIAEYDSFEAYFISRRKWFFGLLALTFVVDYFDTLVKGSDYLKMLGVEYRIHIPVALAGCLAAAISDNRRLHLAFAVIYLLYTISWIGRMYWRVA
jgi:hypothetical protein